MVPLALYPGPGRGCPDPVTERPALPTSALTVPSEQDLLDLSGTHSGSMFREATTSQLVGSKQWFQHRWGTLAPTGCSSPTPPPAYLCRNNAEAHSILLFQGHSDDLGLLPQRLSLEDETVPFNLTRGAGHRVPYTDLIT